jgi:8-oxo-dGTP pyrophosphatase MutT (NUDIX family)
MTTTVRTGSTQYAALPYRIGRDGLEILLITSRDRGRWIIPKGWPITGLTASQAAAREAWEEAGITGTISTDSMGAYGYDKRLNDDTIRHCAAEVFSMEVIEQREAWPEQHQRRREWFDVEQAIECVAEPELRVLMQKLREQLMPAGPQR